MQKLECVVHSAVMNSSSILYSYYPHSRQCYTPTSLQQTTSEFKCTVCLYRSIFGEGYIYPATISAVTLLIWYLQVHIIGDGTADPVVVAGDKLSDQNELENIASSLALPTSIQTTRASLGEKLFE